jgi:DNA-binding transcriptional MerR regulator
MNVKEFSKRVGVSPHTVRYYEKIGLLRGIQRLPNGHRCFSEKDIQWISFVQRLKETGMPLEQIHQYAELRSQGDSTLLARQRLLEAHANTLRRKLAKQQGHLDKLSEKIAFYHSAIANKKGA